jgi:hypothetical protein
MLLALLAAALLEPGQASAQGRAPADRIAPRRGRQRTTTQEAAPAPRSDAERARALLGEADFEGALAAANAAEAGSSLDRDGLVQLLETRVLIQAGLGRQADLERDLARLATLAPDRPAPPSFPPPVAQALARAQAAAVPIGVEAQVSTDALGATVTGAAQGDAGGLVRTVQLVARVGEAAWQSSSTGTLTMEVAPGETLSYYAEAIGPGGVLLATAGSEAEPLTRTRAPALAVDPEPLPVAPPSDDTPLFIGLGVGGGVLVLGVVIVIAAVATSTNDTTLVTLPMER